MTQSLRVAVALIAALLCALAWPSAASVPIGTPVQLGAGTSTTSSTTFQITTGANSPAGNMIIVAAAVTLSATGIPSVTDDAGNIYIAGTSVGSTVRVRLFWCFYCAALPSGSHITITVAAANTNPKLAAAISVSGLNNLDLDGPGATGTGGGGTGSLPTITTGTLGQPSEVLIAVDVVNFGAADSFTEASGFNSNTSALNGGALRWAYKIVNATPGQTYAPTQGTSRAWSVQYETFEAKNCSLGTMGVGSC